VGSSKKQTVGYKYYLGMHMVFCHGPADALYQLRVDNRVAWTGTTTGGQITVAAEGLFGGEKREGGVSGLVDIEMGTPTQVANDYLETQLDDVPGHRGVVAAVLRKCYLGMNPYLKPWSALLQRIYKAKGGAEQWYPGVAAIYSGNQIAGDTASGTTIALSSPGWQYMQVPRSDTTDYSSADFSSWASGSTPFGSGPDGAVQPGKTFWNMHTRMWIARRISGPTGRAYNIRIPASIDDTINIYWNGVAVLTQPDGDSLLTEVNVAIPSGSVTGDDVLMLQAVDRTAVGHPGPGEYTMVDIELTHGVGTNIGLYDMNPAHIIRECLTNDDWGMGYQEADVNDTSFAECADTLYAEGFGMSLIWDRQMPIEDFIKEVLKHIDAALFVERSTGLFTLKLIRDDYDVGTLLELNESNVDRVEDFNRRAFDELYNSITVKYVNSGTNRPGAVEVQDIAQVQMQGAVINTTATYAGISNGAMASKVAARDLKSLSTPLVSCTVYSTMVAKDLAIGDTFKLSWDEYDLVDMVMRVVGISFGDGLNNKVRIQATQDVFAAPTSSYVAIDPSTWVDINVPPAPATAEIVFEAPYYELVQLLGQADTDSLLVTNPDAGYVGAAAVKPTGAINAVLSTDAGAGYQEAGAFDFCPSATIVTALTPTTVSVTLANAQDLDNVVDGTHAQINDEIVVVTDITGLVLTFARGALDTVPAEHAAGSRIYFWSEYYGSDPTEYNTGETINSKVLPITGQGQLALADATALPLTLDQRALRPYPPADFKIDGQYFPTSVVDSFDVTWVHRDRLQQTGGVLLSFTDGSVGPEAGTTYNGFAYDDDTSALLDSATGVAGLLWSPAVTGTVRLRIELESERDTLVSWQRQSWSFDYIGNDGRATDDNDYRVTEDGALRITE
jgi:Putative phage tail protein